MLAYNRFEVSAEIRRVISETMSFPIDGLTDTTLLVDDLGASSMDIVVMSVALDDLYDIEIDLTNLPLTNITIEWITEYILKHKDS